MRKEAQFEVELVGPPGSDDFGYASGERHRQIRHRVLRGCGIDVFGSPAMLTWVNSEVNVVLLRSASQLVHVTASTRRPVTITEEHRRDSRVV